LFTSSESDYSHITTVNRLKQDNQLFKEFVLFDAPLNL